MEQFPRNLFPSDILLAASAAFGTSALTATLLDQTEAATGPTGLPADSPLQTTLLHPREAARLATFKLAKRRSEFHSGRISAKMAMVSYWAREGSGPIPPFDRIAIVNDNTGRPFVCIDSPVNIAPPEISITHGGEYAAALAAASPCGIDIQLQRDNLFRVREKYSLPDELRLLKELLPDTAALARLSMLWTAKEAAKKALSFWQMPGFLELALISPADILPSGITLRFAVRIVDNLRMPETVTVLATTFANYGLAICVIEKEKCHA
ncbi:MAG: 4'-phosphopantetheinyl transferase superfamily protein [Desulforhopalus sp.]|nr:4'-phosphopantetheinyl transferase superfamily protein [Desulforhopalus sp.]